MPRPKHRLVFNKHDQANKLREAIENIYTILDILDQEVVDEISVTVNDSDDLTFVLRKELSNLVDEVVPIFKEKLLSRLSKLEEQYLTLYQH